MYYRLDQNKTEQNTFVRSTSHREVMLTTGQPLGPIGDLPFRFEMEVTESYDQFDPDYEGPDQGEPEPHIFAYYRNVSLMHKALVEALLAAGVDNLETFPAAITDTSTGAEFGEHLVVNIIGSVACANLSASETQPLGELHYFLRLAIDPKLTGGLRLFRLAEYPPEILVDDRIAASLADGDFPGLLIEPVEEVPVG